MVHVAESTIGRRYAGWFIRNTEGAQHAYDTLKAAPLPLKKDAAAAPAAPVQAAQPAQRKGVTWAVPKTEVAAAA